MGIWLRANTEKGISQSTVGLVMERKSVTRTLLVDV